MDVTTLSASAFVFAPTHECCSFLHELSSNKILAQDFSFGETSVEIVSILYSEAYNNLSLSVANTVVIQSVLMSDFTDFCAYQDFTPKHKTKYSAREKNEI